MFIVLETFQDDLEYPLSSSLLTIRFLQFFPKVSQGCSFPLDIS